MYHLFNNFCICTWLDLNLVLLFLTVGIDVNNILSGAGDEDDQATFKRVNRVSSPERWELKQMIAANCINKSELPDFDEEVRIQRSAQLPVLVCKTYKRGTLPVLNMELEMVYFRSVNHVFNNSYQSLPY